MLRRRTWAVLGISLCLLLLEIAYGWHRFANDLATDEPDPPFTKSLRVNRREILDADNAFPLLLQVVPALDMPKKEEGWGDEVVKGPAAGDGSGPLKVAEVWSKLGDGEAWDEVIAAEVLRRNARALELWERAMAVPECQYPPVTFSFYIQEITPQRDWVEVVKVVSVRARLRARGGEWPAAYADLMSLVRFGHRMEGAKGPIPSYELGAIVKNFGCERIRHMLPEAALTPEELKALAGQLASYPANEQGLADSFRVEYEAAERTIDDLMAGKVVGRDFLMKDGCPDPDRASRWAKTREFLVKPNRTKSILAAACLEAAGNVSGFCNQARETQITRLKLACKKTPCQSRSTMSHEMLCLLMERLEGIATTKYEENVEIGATRVLLAMKAFKLDKGRLPATLDELVPAYLDAVPLDDFDGKPLRYNPAKKIIYSVGEDLKDDGGMTKKEYVDYQVKERGIDKYIGAEELKSYEDEYPGQGPDPSFPIDF